MELFEIVHLMHKLNLVQRIVSTRAANETGLRRERLGMLRYISKNDGCTQRNLAQTLHISPASAAMSVKRMEKAGLITRSVDPLDLRCNRLHLTEDGQDYLQRCRQMFRTLDEQMFAGFSNEELGTLLDMFKRLISNIGGEEMANMSFFDILALDKELEKQQEDLDA